MLNSLPEPDKRKPKPRKKWHKIGNRLGAGLAENVVNKMYLHCYLYVFWGVG